MSVIGDFLAPVNSGLTGAQREKALYVSSIIRDVFGINSLVYFPGTSKHSMVPKDFLGIEIIPGDEAEQISSLGTPVVGTVEFLSGEYNIYDEKGRVVKKKMENFMLPYSCIVEFSRAAVITQTKTLGNTGTLKEIYGLDDWRITIRGIALNDATDPNAPGAHYVIEQLSRWRKVCDSIKVQGALFSSKDIYNIVIEELSIQPIEGKYNTIPFQITAISDEPVEMQIP